MKIGNSLGVKAFIKFKTGTHATYRNLTEVHFNAPISHTITAFESNIHQTGVTVNTSDITEMEITMETEIARSIEG